MFLYVKNNVFNLLIWIHFNKYISLNNIIFSICKINIKQVTKELRD